MEMDLPKIPILAVFLSTHEYTHVRPHLHFVVFYKLLCLFLCGLHTHNFGLVSVIYLMY